MPDQQSYFERRAKEERMRAFDADDPSKAAAHRRRAGEFDYRANAARALDY